MQKGKHGRMDRDGRWVEFVVMEDRENDPGVTRAGENASQQCATISLPRHSLLNIRRSLLNIRHSFAEYLTVVHGDWHYPGLGDSINAMMAGMGGTGTQPIISTLTSLDSSYSFPLFSLLHSARSAIANQCEYHFVGYWKTIRLTVTVSLVTPLLSLLVAALTAATTVIIAPASYWDAISLPTETRVLTLNTHKLIRSRFKRGDCSLSTGATEMVSMSGERH
jgi:hypothetical protein